MEVSRHSAEVAACLLESGVSVRLRVTGWSMKPLIRPGYLVRMVAQDRALQTGDIVVYRSGNGQLITHRVVSVRETSVRTKGDGCAGVDEPVSPSQILGRLVAVEKPIFVPLDGLLARWVGCFLGFIYPELVKLKLAVARAFRLHRLEGNV